MNGQYAMWTGYNSESYVLYISESYNINMDSQKQILQQTDWTSISASQSQMRAHVRSLFLRMAG